MADVYKKALIAELGTRYEICGKYAEGGMGKIYIGIHKTLGKQVAIKVIDQRFCSDKKMRKRFFKEAKLVANLTHKGIIDIYDFGSREEFDFLIMPFIEGITLSKKLQNEGRLPHSESLYITQSVAEALAFAQKKKVVHRDIKPSNILIDKQQQVVLSDFGICKDLTDPEVTASCMILGSPKYMSPEQALAQPVDGRSDLYSLGLVFYEMVTGQYAFKGKDVHDLLYLQVHENPPQPKRIVSDISEPVNDVIMKLLRKSPEHRYQTAEELIADLLRGVSSYPYTEIRSPQEGDLETLVQPSQIPSEEDAPGFNNLPERHPRKVPQSGALFGGNKDSKVALSRFARRFSYKWFALLFGSLIFLAVSLYGLRTILWDEKQKLVQSETKLSESIPKEKGVPGQTIDLKMPSNQKKAKEKPPEIKTAKQEQSDVNEPVSVSPYQTAVFQIMQLGREKDATFLNVWSNQSKYQIGDKISYHFKSKEPCYLVLLNKTSGGNIVQIFPNKFDPMQFVEANREYTIPREDLEFSLEVTGPSGSDELIVLASNKPFELFPQDYEHEAFIELSDKNQDNSMKILKNLIALKSMEFSQSRVSYPIDE